jgi:hypothetical protein
LAFSPSTGRLKPVLIGSMKTRSVSSSREYSLSVSWKGGLGRSAFVFHHHPARAEHAHVQPNGRGAGAAVKREGQRAFGFVVDAVEGVGGEEHGRLGLVALGFFLAVAFFFQDDGAGGDGVMLISPIFAFSNITKF